MFDHWIDILIYVIGIITLFGVLGAGLFAIVGVAVKEWESKDE